MWKYGHDESGSAVYRKGGYVGRISHNGWDYSWEVFTEEAYQSVLNGFRFLPLKSGHGDRQDGMADVKETIENLIEGRNHV